MNELTGPLTLSSVTTFLAIYQSALLAPLLVIFIDLSGPFLVLAPGKWLSRNTPRASPGVLVKSPFGSRNGFSMAPLSFARIFLSLVYSGILFIDSQKPLYLWFHKPLYLWSHKALYLISQAFISPISQTYKSLIQQTFIPLISKNLYTFDLTNLYTFDFTNLYTFDLTNLYTFDLTNLYSFDLTNLCFSSFSILTFLTSLVEYHYDRASTRMRHFVFMCLFILQCSFLKFSNFMSETTF